ncbi:MAG: patatin-like phospholipase family protein [Burkholderiales bacterium]
MSSILEKLKFIFSRFAEAWQLLRLTLFSLVLVISGGIFLAWVPQGQDLLRIVAGETRNPYFRQHQIFFVIASLTWALAAWYCARVLVTRRLPTAPADNLFQVQLRIWLPRVYGALALFVLALGFWQVGERSWTMAFLILTAAFLLFVVKRRAWFGNFPGTVKTQVDKLPPVTRKLIQWSLAISFVLFGLFVAFPVRPAQTLGAMAILLFAMTSWIIFGSFILILLPKIYGWPSMALLPLLFFIVFSPFNDNHEARGISDFQPVDCEKEKDYSRCQNVALHFSAWLSARAKQQTATYPVYIIAAEGGGIRAAYWTAAVLAALHEREKNFSEHVYAISAVSGGALGAAVYGGLLAQQKQSGAETSRCATQKYGETNFSSCARAILSHDFLSPTLAYLLYPDMMQRLLPGPIAAFDRARALEYSWEDAWQSETGNDQFGASFLSLWRGREAAVPALFFNSTLVETGQRVIFSNVRVDTLEFYDALDGFRAPLLLPESALSTTVNFSARFSFISPPARVATGKGSAHLVDGGYHENTGALTASEILRAVEKTIASKSLNARPVVVVIRNQPFAERDYISGEFLGEWVHPVQVILNTRKAHSAIYLDSMAAALNRPSEPQQFFVVQPPRESAPAPLGWYMSLSTTRALDASLNDSGTVKKLDEILDVLKTPPPPKPLQMETRP